MRRSQHAPAHPTVSVLLWELSKLTAETERAKTKKVGEGKLILLFVEESVELES